MAFSSISHDRRLHVSTEGAAPLHPLPVAVSLLVTAPSSGRSALLPWIVGNRSTTLSL